MATKDNQFTKKQLLGKLTDLLSEYSDDDIVTIAVITGNGYGEDRVYLDGIGLMEYDYGLHTSDEVGTAIIHIYPT